MHFDGLDEIDNRILEIIKDNARITYKEIGDAVGISRVSVKNRMDILQKKGIIQGFKTVMDPSKQDSFVKFFLDIECEPDRYEDICETLSKSKIINEIYSVTGDCRIICIGMASNIKNMEYLVNTIYRSKLGVRRLRFTNALATLMDRNGGVVYERFDGNEHLEGKAAEKE